MQKLSICWEVKGKDQGEEEKKGAEAPSATCSLHEEVAWVKIVQEEEGEVRFEEKRTKIEIPPSDASTRMTGAYVEAKLALGADERGRGGRGGMCVGLV
eukprot:750828-Hanusia_phi.AAC.3